ncbi:DUF2442 domain-containing protein [Methylomusa anaerophila]|uniref:DUF2442 domain-containing protein n=1 Tax=Methylomusa anaerophila TaxID=1930071 RepID=A0A348AKA7_9FIRM|nr:DUF2442 domain-containing protein [Methylomusa anaerophila]BBB91505.1 hypothetical protein MAMMFC1_02189 [Methylomusa anaerophila]
MTLFQKVNLIKQVKSVTPLDDYELLLEFNTGEKRIFDVKPLLDKPVFQPLRNKELFKKVHIVFDYTIAWNDDIDMCPDNLYLQSVPVNC